MEIDAYTGMPLGRPLTPQPHRKKIFGLF